MTVDFITPTPPPLGGAGTNAFFLPTRSSASPFDSLLSTVFSAAGAAVRLEPLEMASAALSVPSPEVDGGVLDASRRVAIPRNPVHNNRTAL